MGLVIKKIEGNYSTLNLIMWLSNLKWKGSLILQAHWPPQPILCVGDNDFDLSIFYHCQKNTAFTIHCYRGSFHIFCNIGSLFDDVALTARYEWLPKKKFELFVKGSWRRQWISSTWSPSAHSTSPSYSRDSRTLRSLARPARWSDW